MSRDEDRAPLVTPRVMTRMISRFNGTCPRCRGYIRRGVLIGYDPASRLAYHAGCADNVEGERERERLPL